MTLKLLKSNAAGIKTINGYINLSMVRYRFINIFKFIIHVIQFTDTLV